MPSSLIARAPRWLLHAAGVLVLWVLLAALAFAFRQLLVGDWRSRDAVDLWLMLERATILYSFLMMGVVLYSGAIGLMPRGWLRRLVSGRRRFEDAESIEIRDKADAVVMLVGKNSELWRVSVDLLKPTHLVLIGTSAEMLVDAKHVAGSGVRTTIARVVRDESNSGEVLRIGREVLAKLMREDGVSRERIVCDITGAFKPMSIGLFMAAEEAGVAAAYIRTDRELQSGKPIDGTARLRYITRPPGG